MTDIAAVVPGLRDRSREWIEADGLGGFASGTVPGIRTRRYHALLLAASTPPAGRFALVNALEVWATAGDRTVPLSSHLYGPGIVHPDGLDRIVGFESEPWPRWQLRFDNGTTIVHEVFARHRAPVVVLAWRVLEPGRAVQLMVRPLLSGRDPHALHRENPGFRFDADTADGGVRFRPYPGVPAVLAAGNGTYEHRPEWYRNFLLAEERARGLDFVEDLASPGIFRFDLSRGEAFLVLAAEGEPLDAFLCGSGDGLSGARLRESERRRRGAFPSPLHRAADAYLARRGDGETILAGYPWFGDWGRDAFISVRGLCLATGRVDEAGKILSAWAGAVSRGMLPNRFPDRGDEPEYNSVDASLWYVIAVHETLQALARAGRARPGELEKALRAAVETILSGYAQGTRFGIRLDQDGLLASGAPGTQLTWMDAKVGDWVVTPRTGKAVEIQALWLNALSVAGAWSSRWTELLGRGLRSFRERFWNAEGGYLYDVVDADHEPGRVDASFRPNQILAVGGLPWAVLDDDRARLVVDEVERRLLTPLGLRSLAPDDPRYVASYGGGVRERDGAYHQGTVWPWLLGPFVEAWVRVRGRTAEAKRVARARFLEPLIEHLEAAGLGHVSEIADAAAPHTPRGCPFQAWSVAELLRLREMVLAEAKRSSGKPRASRPGRRGLAAPEPAP